jgi:hypothetical protein
MIHSPYSSCLRSQASQLIPLCLIAALIVPATASADTPLVPCEEGYTYTCDDYMLCGCTPTGREVPVENLTLNFEPIEALATRPESEIQLSSARRAGSPSAVGSDDLTSSASTAGEIAMEELSIAHEGLAYTKLICADADAPFEPESDPVLSDPELSDEQLDGANEPDWPGTPAPAPRRAPILPGVRREVYSIWRWWLPTARVVSGCLRWARA